MYKKLQELFKRITTFLHLNKRLSKYFIFLLISLAVWFLTVMSKEYETTIVIPVVYTNLPENKQLINQPENQIKLEVRSYGFYLLSNNLFKSRSLNIAANTLAEKRFKDYSQKQLIVKQNHKRLYKILPSDIKILNVSPDTLFLRFQQKNNKKVPVVFNGDINFSSQYRLKNKIQILPDSISIFGTKEDILKIPFIETDNVVFDNLEKDIKQNINLRRIDGISFSKEKVEIKFEVEKYTEKIIELSLKAVNVPKGYKIKFYPPKIEIVATVAFDNFDKLNSSLFGADVDASDLEGKKSIVVKLSSTPSFVDIIRIRPSRVEFLLIKQ